MTLPITNCETEIKFSKPSTTKNKFRSTVLEEKLNYLSILSIKFDNTISLSYKEAIKEYAAKNARRVLQKRVRQLIYKNIIFFFFFFADCLTCVVYLAFFKFVVYCDLFFRYK